MGYVSKRGFEEKEKKFNTTNLINVCDVYNQSLEVNRTGHIDLLLQTFYSGRPENLTDEERAIIRDYATRLEAKNYIFTGIRDHLVCFQGKGCEEANAPLASDIRH